MSQILEYNYKEEEEEENAEQENGEIKKDVIKIMKK